MTKMHCGFESLLSKYLENVKYIFGLQQMGMLIFSADKRKERENTDFSVSWKFLNFLKQNKKNKNRSKKRLVFKSRKISNLRMMVDGSSLEK